MWDVFRILEGNKAKQGALGWLKSAASHAGGTTRKKENRERYAHPPEAIRVSRPFAWVSMLYQDGGGRSEPRPSRSVDQRGWNALAGFCELRQEQSKLHDGKTGI